MEHRETDLWFCFISEKASEQPWGYTAGNRINDSTRVRSHIRTPALQAGTDTTVHSTVSPDAEQWTLRLDLLSLLLLTPGQHTATSAMCAKALSPVQPLCHRVLSQSPACGHLPGGASGSFNLQECLEVRFSVLWRKVGSVYYQDCQVWWWFSALSHVQLLRPHWQ